MQDYDQIRKVWLLYQLIFILKNNNNNFENEAIRSFKNPSNEEKEEFIILLEKLLNSNSKK